MRKKNIWKISRIMTSSWLLADAKVLRYIATLLPQRSFIFYLRIFLIFISQFSSLEESWARTRRNLVFVQTFYRVTESTLYTFLFCFALLPPNVDVVALLRLDEGISSIKYQSSISILLFCFFFYLGRLVLRWRETLLWLNKPCAIIDTGGREESSFRVARSGI